MYKFIFTSLTIFFFQCVFSQINTLSLSYENVKKLAEMPLHCIDVEYPNKLNQVLTDSTYLESPKKLHPIFYGCFDWHSSVHGYWLLANVMNKYSESDVAKKIIDLFDEKFTAENVAIELAYFEPKLEKSFERTYGWAWFLKLYAELSISFRNYDHKWTENLAPLKNYIVDAYKSFLPKLVYPIRVGEHSNSAFGLSLALDFAYAVEDYDFVELINQRSKDYFLNDKNCPLNWEPSGFDFISPCLQEAELMSKVLEPDAFEKWIKEFLPEIFKKDFNLEPGKVLDRTDGKLVHIDGLNFSRAQCFYVLAKSLPKCSTKFISLGDAHVKTSMQHVVGSDYMGGHWLATFLVFALEARDLIAD